MSLSTQIITYPKMILIRYDTMLSLARHSLNKFYIILPNNDIKQSSAQRIKYTLILFMIID